MSGGRSQQRYGYLLDEWELFDDTIKGLAKDKSLPDDFRDYMPAVVSGFVM